MDIGEAVCVEYRRGDIIHAYPGMNAGTEEGGARYAVVVDKNNPSTSKVITVIHRLLESKLPKGFGKNTDTRWRAASLCWMGLLYFVSVRPVASLIDA